MSNPQSQSWWSSLPRVFDAMKTTKPFGWVAGACRQEPNLSRNFDFEELLKKSECRQWSISHPWKGRTWFALN
jgi:hypothetical protein